MFVLTELQKMAVFVDESVNCFDGCHFMWDSSLTYLQSRPLSLSDLQSQSRNEANQSGLALVVGDGSLF